ncbi:MAG: hypothetical protein AAAB11_09595 [Rhizobium giardinii]
MNDDAKPIRSANFTLFLTIGLEVLVIHLFTGGRTRIRHESFARKKASRRAQIDAFRCPPSSRIPRSE